MLKLAFPFFLNVAWLIDHLSTSDTIRYTCKSRNWNIQQGEDQTHVQTWRLWGLCSFTERTWGHAHWTSNMMIIKPDISYVGAGYMLLILAVASFTLSIVVQGRLIYITDILQEMKKMWTCFSSDVQKFFKKLLLNEFKKKSLGGWGSAGVSWPQCSCWQAWVEPLQMEVADSVSYSSSTTQSCSSVSAVAARPPPCAITTSFGSANIWSTAVSVSVRND